jgi:hypothetical protein
VPTLRSDLRRVDERADYDYYVLNDFSFAYATGPGPGPVPGLEVVYRARAGNQDIGWVYRRIRDR